MEKVEVSCPNCGASVPADPDKPAVCPECRREVRAPASKPANGVNDLIARLVGEGANRWRLETIHNKVSQILTSEERIKYISVQRRPIINIAPDAVILTNRRFIVYHQMLFGRVHFEDYVWRELSDVRLKEGLLASTLFFQISGDALIEIDWLPKPNARRIYAMSQEMEERVKEERRLREMEERRAAAGGVIIQGGAGGGPSGLPGVEDPVQKLKQLKEMLDAGLITPGEYEAKRQAILSRM